MDIIKKHVDTVIVLGGILGSVMWMNHQFNNVDKQLSKLEKDMAVMKAVLIVREVMPKELALATEIGHGK
jgi:hypothetical protein